MNLKKNRARADPAKLLPMKIGAEAQFLPVWFQNRIANAIAGFTGLACKYLSLMPARSIAPRYDPARMMVYTAASLVNLVFSSVELRYIKTKKKLPMISTTTCCR